MAERRKRRQFAPEFKARAVRRLLEGAKGLAGVATELGTSGGQLSAWRNERLAAGSAEALAACEVEQAEAQRLGRENKRLEEEVEIRKKAAALFAGGIAWAGAGSPSWPPGGRTMPWRGCAASSARASAASTPGCARSPSPEPGEGWLCPAAVEDLATREVVGWSMADHLRAGLRVDALVTALQRCDPPRGLLHHSDRGALPGLKGSPRRLPEPIVAPRRRPRRAFSSRGSRAVWR